MSLLPHHTSDPDCPLCDDKLAQADPRLVHWFLSAKVRHPDIHVSWSYRDEVSQDQAVQEGKSKLAYPKSAHNKLPALAIDLFQINEAGQALWNKSFFEQLDHENEQAQIKIKWGGNWVNLGDDDHWEVDPV